MATAILWTWRTRWIHQRRRTCGHSVQEWTSVSVALILLFFAVSMSDDLHWEMVLFDESSTSRLSSSLSVDEQQPTVHYGAAHRVPGAGLVSPTIAIGVRFVIQRVVVSAKSSFDCLHVQPSSGRAPPLPDRRA